MKLFEPMTIGKVTLRNRLVFAPYETNYATEEGVITRRQIEHYRKAAGGGVGVHCGGGVQCQPRSFVQIH